MPPLNDSKSEGQTGGIASDEEALSDTSSERSVPAGTWDTLPHSDGQPIHGDTSDEAVRLGARDTAVVSKRYAGRDLEARPGQIIVSDFGTFIGKKSERLVIKKGKDVLEQVPFHNIESLVVTGAGVSISTDVIQECMEHGIQIDFLTFSGKPYAKLTSPGLSGTVITRREQLLAYYEKRGLKLAKAFVDGKLRNQQGLIHYFARYRKSEDQEAFDELSRMEAKILEIASELESIEGKCVDDVREQLLSIEGRAGAVYWDGVKKILGDRVEFETREHRGADDPFNSMLNYGYGILYSTVWGAVVLAGLEPFAGFIHTDRPGKPSLCLDLVEEFRQRVVDRTVISFVTKGTPIKLQDGMLADQTRRKLIDNIQERLESRETYRGKQHKLRTIIQLQARRIASFLRGETDYRPHVGRW